MTILNNAWGFIVVLVESWNPIIQTPNNIFRFRIFKSSELSGEERTNNAPQNSIISSEYTSHASGGNGFHFEHLVHRPCPVVSFQCISSGDGGEGRGELPNLFAYSQLAILRRDGNGNKSIPANILSLLCAPYSTEIAKRSVSLLSDIWNGNCWGTLISIFRTSDFLLSMVSLENWWYFH